MSLKLGINDVGNEEYHADRTFLSSSGLKLLLKDTKAFHKQYILNEKVTFGNQSALDLGTYAHTACFEPHLLEEQFVVFEGRKAGKVWEEFQEQNKGKIILGSLQKTQGEMIKEAFEQSAIIKDLVKEGEAEKTLCVKLEDLRIKVRADFINIHGNTILDLKTTSGSLDYYTLQKTVAKYHYDLSAALYVDAFSQHFNKPFDFYFLFVDKSSYSVQVVKASEELLLNGRLKYRKAIKNYRECIKTKEWGKEEILTLRPADWDREFEEEENGNV